MSKFLRTLCALSGLALVGAVAPMAQAAQPHVRLWRLDCGEIQMNDASPLSDAGAYTGQARRLTDSCYLIQHGQDYVLWDTGLPTALLGKPIDKAPLAPTLKADLVSQLARIGVRPDQISRLGISHYHFDHVGQAATFPKATLMIGSDDWAALMSGKDLVAADPDRLAPWLKDGGKVELVEGDRDVFGDGSVVILAAPGHTPGETALLVRLAKTGPVILSGDVVHLEAQWKLGAVPIWNTDHAQSVASMSRLQSLAKDLKATIVVQHDPDDVAQLAAFPAASR